MQYSWSMYPSSSWKVYNLARKCFEVSHNITFFETKFPSGKEFHLRSANFRGDNMPRAMDNFVAPLVAATHAPPVAPSVVAKDVLPVMYDMIVVEPPPTA